MILNECDLTVFMYTNNILTELYTEYLEISTSMARIKKITPPPAKKKKRQNTLPSSYAYIVLAAGV